MAVRKGLVEVYLVTYEQDGETVREWRCQKKYANRLACIKGGTLEVKRITRDRFYDLFGFRV